MIRSVWCPNCKTVVNTVIKDSKEVCPACGNSVSRSSAGDPTTDVEEESD